MDDLERWEDLDVRSGPSRSQEGNCVWWSLCSVNCCFFVLVEAMAQAMACSCSVASKFAWKLSSESPLFASSRSCSSCSSPIALFSFSFSSSFRKVRAIQRQRLRSHVLALAGCGSPSLSPFHHLEDLIFNLNFFLNYFCREVCAHCEFLADGFQGVMRVVTMKKKKEVVARKGRGRGIQCWRSLCSTWIRQSSYGHWRDGIRLHWCPQPLLLGFRFWCWPYTHPHTLIHTLSPAWLLRV